MEAERGGGGRNLAVKREREEVEDLDARRPTKNLFWASRLPLPQLPRLCAISYSRERMARRQRPHCLLRGGRRARSRGRSPPSPLLSSFTYGRSVCTLSKLNFCRAQGDPSDVRPSAHITPSSVRPSIHAAMMSDEKKPRFPFFFFSSSRPRPRSRRRASLMRVFICAP